jgi:5'-phosphate synthase pdxT subunit
MILLAMDVLDGRPDQRSFGMIDIAVRRNGYGRQVDSFEDDVTVLARYAGVPVLARQGTVLVASFHPELSGDARLHALFLEHASALT